MLKFGKIQFTLEQCFLALIIFVAAYLAIDKRFIQDDAYISFVYARNFAEGHGLRWYPGSDEYGYTNFLFTVMVGILMKFGFSPEFASYMLTFPAALISLPLVYGIGKKITRSSIPAWAATVALATNHTFLSYATGGLETSVVLCLVYTVYYLALHWEEDLKHSRIIIISLFAVLSLLIRLDSAILLVPAYVFLLWGLRKQLLPNGRVNIRVFLRFAVNASALPLCGVSVVLGFCYWYYGYALPTTFHAKLDSWYVIEGLSYIYAFVRAQFFVPAIYIMVWFFSIRLDDLSRINDRYTWLLSSSIMLWMLYILHTGGDFMEFRFILPILPFFYLLMFKLLVDLLLQSSRKRLLYFLLFLSLVGNYAQPYYFSKKSMDENFIESTFQLNDWVAGEPYNWSFLGKRLKELFYTGSEEDVKLAVTAAGAISYYSELPVVDRHGLNTRRVLLDGNTFEHIARPGHRRKSKIAFLANNGVNLVIDHPIFVKKLGNRFTCIPAPMKISHEPLKDIMPVFVPLSQDVYLLAHYLIRHPLIEEKIASGEIIKYKNVVKQVFCGKNFIIPGYEEPKSS
ncbi:MAG: hypothetical protein ACK502_09585 [Alphaproteobacteria bacterium]